MNGRFIAVPILALILGCSGSGSPVQADFAGKWKSSRLTTPIHLHQNGEWEIEDGEGGILQYGTWHYEDDRILWSHKGRGGVTHDMNRVLSVAPREFRLREQNGSETTFVRLD